MRAVEVLPLVPVTWTTGYACCGSPSSAQAWMRSKVGGACCSGQRS